MTTALLARAAALLESAESMIGLLRDHTEELASGEAYDELAIDAYAELQVSAQALRAIIDTEAQAIRVADIGATNTAFDALVAMHAHLHEHNAQIGFEISFTPGFGWQSRICDRSSIPHRVTAYGAGETTEEACENALDQLTAKPDNIPESEIPY